MSPLLAAVLATLLVSALALVGIVFVALPRRGRHAEAVLVSFAAGVLLATSFLELAPEAVKHAGGDGRVFAAALVAMLAFFVLERFLHGFHEHEGYPPLERHRRRHVVAPAWLILIGDGLHNFIDGIVIGASFTVNMELGIITTLAVAVHEIPQELADFGILVAGGLSVRTALALNFASGLTSVAGALGVFAFTSALEANIAWFMTATLGMFVYIAGSDLIPQLHHHERDLHGWIYLPFLGGIALIAFLTAATHS